MSAPRVAPHVDLTPVDGQGLVVLLAVGHELFAGAEYVAIARAADGVRTDEELLTAAATEIPEGDLRRALAELRSAGVLVDHDDRVDSQYGAFWTRDGHSPGEVADRLAQARLALAVVGDVDAQPTQAALAEAGARVEADGELLLVLTDDYLRPELGALNDDALETGRPWMLAAPAAAEISIGPLFVPDRGACWECLAQRLRRHRSIELYLRDAAGRVAPVVRPGASLPATRMAAAGMIAAQVVRTLVLGRRVPEDRLVTVDPRSWQTASHAVTRRPQCPACGFPEEVHDRAATPVVTGGGGEAVPGGEELRSVAPETTTERFVRHVSPVSGVVARLTRVSSARPPLHVYLAGDPGPRKHGTDNCWKPAEAMIPGGKGTTDAQARASALCEALERYSGEFQGDEPRRSGSFSGLEPVAIHPNDCMGFSESQYARREETNAVADSFRTFVPARFDPDSVVEWTPVWSLTHERERLLPTAYCYYGAQVPGHDACLADSNGNAAGNTIEEAILHGLLELVERDHVALWWFNRLRVPAVDLESLADPWLDSVLARFAADERRVWALDLTADLGIPVVAAVTTPGSRPGGVGLGFGAHLDITRAAVRAVTELVQLGAGTPSGGAGHGPPEAVDAAASSYLHAAEGPTGQTTQLRDGRMTGDLRADLEGCRRSLEAAGLEVLVLDQTRPDVGLPVVKVTAPGLRHFWPRFAPGRLYDVPVELGLTPQRLSEAQLNPVPPVA